jgi:hypothetical protein
MTKRSIGMRAVVAALGLGMTIMAGGCGAEDEPASMAVGSEGGVCTTGGSCDPGLTCLSQRCVRAGGTAPGTGGTGGASGPGTAGAPGGPPAADDTSGFTGSWKYTSGSSAAQCQQGMTPTKQLVGTFFQLKRGTDAPLLFVPQGTTCSLKMDVAGNVATFRSGTSCSYAEGGQSFRLEAGEGGSIALNSANNGNVAFAGSLTVIAAATLVCTYTINGTATRISPE